MVAAIARGDSDARVKEYRLTIILHVVVGSLPVVVWLVPGRSLASLGLLVPNASVSFWLSAGAAALIVAFFVWQGRMLAQSAEARQVARGQLGRLEQLLPHTERELSLFGVVSLSAGVFEEILYRGFLMWYAVQLMPIWTAVIATSAAFGVAHVYQGAGGIIKTGVVGLVLATLYVLSGSLWIPIVLHWLTDHVQGRMLHRVMQTA
jgi:membrane protease YdiL (CAAX protease family)